MKALIIVDMQKDFMPGGPLGVPEADKMVPLINDLQKEFDVVVATRDWHPQDHCSFITEHEDQEVGDVVKHEGLDQIIWPRHCVRETPGAELVEDLNRDRLDKVFDKGIEKDIDSYSGFFDNGHRRATGLGDYLKDKGVDAVYLAGVATDVCIKFTAIDAAKLDFKTHVIQDAVRGVELEEGDITRAIQAMRENGVRLVPSEEVRN